MWTAAAYERFRDGGLADVRVETVARDVGATKGSFYWHFDNRAALVRAVMARWEEEETEALIRAADTATTARGRIERLFAEVTARTPGRRGERLLYADARREGVGDVVDRVTARRIDYLAALLVEAGIVQPEARRRSVIALATVVGLVHLGSSVRADVGAAGELTATAVRMVLGS